MNLREQLERASAAEPPSRGQRLRFHGARIGLAVALAVFTYVLFPASPAVDFPIYEVGSVASDNVIAPFAFSVPKTDADLAKEQNALMSTVAPVFTYVPAALDSSRRQLAAFAEAVNAAAANADPRTVVLAIQQAAARQGVPLNAAEAAYLSTERRRRAMLTAVDRVFERWLGAGVASRGALDNVRGDVSLRSNGEERRVPADSLANFSMLVARARLVHPDPGSDVGDGLYLRLLGAFFHPTLVPDLATTQMRRDEMRRSVPRAKYEVRAGEKIVGANEVVGREEHDKLRTLHDEVDRRRASERGVRRVAGAILFNFLILSLLGLTLLIFRPQVYRNFRWLLMFAGLTVLVLAGGAIVGHTRPIHPELVPVALAAVVLSALFDQRISMIAAMVLATLVGGQSVFRGTNGLFINLVGGAVAAFSVRAVSRRNQTYRWIVAIAAAYLVTAVAIGLTLDLPTGEVLSSAGFGALNALVSVLLALLILPMAEALTGIETDLTLLEWSDLNRPLMQRLSLEAPGTYAHTIAIANLAEAAARAIGANALLARVGAYYHDIGKIARPQYFVENQPRGRNPHDKLKPGTSAQIIRNHVREGLQLAEEHKLPRALRAFITEHHGTGAISYFYEKARERGGSAPNPQEYTYPGPLPQSAETAVVMLADGVEAATRVLADPTPEKIREVVDHIVRQRIEQGQLRDAPLTLRQLDIVKDQFARVLTGMYHNRIDYPAASGGVTSEFASV
ncbi:MAG TPA: HDIG domain-containing protein [Gemmatimonadaceae bacterium]|nr:HDIG domain-containing protein [Gemmatimonadaceae bacterium]